ncbi:MAG: peroxiredoxin [Myxococcota bacterium]|jgi:peroxiredoxin
MKLHTLALLAPMLLAGCLSFDSDDDGLTNAEEEDLGTNPDKADSDGDGIDDADEVDDGTDPTEADSDGDGLEDGEEADYGTDALSADSDTDGVSDGIEVSNDSDPLNVFSWPGDGIWPDNRAKATESSTYAYDEVFPDFTAPDRFGVEVSLHQFWGQTILLDFSAGWCGPCKTVAKDAEEMWNDQREDGFVIVHAMTDGATGAADEEFLNEWADDYDLTFPVLGEGEIEDTYYALASAGLNEGYIPYMLVLAPDMTLRSIYVGGGTESQIASEVEDILAE